MNMPYRFSPSVVFSISLSLVAVPALATTTYRVEELATLTGSTENEVRAIGPTGAVVGSALAFDSQAVMWDEAGNITDLSRSGAYAVAVDVNAHHAAPVVDSASAYNFLWSNGGLRTINAQGRLKAINDAGFITGWHGDSTGTHAFMWRDGVTTWLPDVPNSTGNHSNAINNRGQLAGFASVSGARRAALWSDGVGTSLGTLPGFSSSWATAINDVGDVVGYVYNGSLSHGGGVLFGYPTSSTARAFLWRDGAMREVPGIDGAVWTVANSINRDGHVVGYSLTGMDQLRNRVAFITKDGAVQNLNRVLGDSSCLAVDINDAGQIAAGCGYRAFRLTPIAAAVDAGVQLAASSATATQGSPFTYVLTVSNSGALPASGVNVGTTLPDNVELNSIVASQGACSGTSAITCAVGDIASGDAATVEITVTPTATGTLVSSASVAAAEADTNDFNKSASLSVTVKAPSDTTATPTADVALSMSTSTTRPRVRRDLVYSIAVSNKGPQAATDVRVTDSLPAGTTLVSASASVGGCSTTTTSGVNTVICSLGKLGVNANATVNIVVKPTVSGQLSNTATVSTTSSDPGAANNSATVTTTVR